MKSSEVKITLTGGTGFPIPPASSTWLSVSPFALKIFAAIFYGLSSFLITVVNKITLTSYK